MSQLYSATCQSFCDRLPINSSMWQAHYTMATAGGLRHRLRPDGSGYSNLYLAGDWVRNGLDIGCVEGAALAGRQAAEALMRDSLNPG